MLLKVVASNVSSDIIQLSSIRIIFSFERCFSEKIGFTYLQKVLLSVTIEGLRLLK